MGGGGCHGYKWGDWLLIGECNAKNNPNKKNDTKKLLKKVKNKYSPHSKFPTAYLYRFINQFKYQSMDRFTNQFTHQFIYQESINISLINQWLHPLIYQLIEQLIVLENGCHCILTILEVSYILVKVWKNKTFVWTHFCWFLKYSFFVFFAFAVDGGWGVSWL